MHGASNRHWNSAKKFWKTSYQIILCHESTQNFMQIFSTDIYTSQLNSVAYNLLIIFIGFGIKT